MSLVTYTALNEIVNTLEHNKIDVQIFYLGKNHIVGSQYRNQVHGFTPEDVRRKTIDNLESGKCNPTLVLAWSIAKVFGVTIE